MIEEREIITLLLGVGATFLAVSYRRSLAYLASWNLLLAAVSLLLLGWASTVLEGFQGGEAFDVIEHACYGLSSFLVAIWAFRTARGRRSSVGGNQPWTR